MTNRNPEQGFALITVLVLLALLMALLLTHFSLTWIEMSTTRSSMRSFVGFYAAEAGLNVRAELVRQAFTGFSQPSGTAPDPDSPCTGSNQGSDDFACVSYAFQDRKVQTYLEEQSSSIPIVIPRGESYQDLNAHEFHYVVYSTAYNDSGSPEAILEMHFKSRSVPMFQFAAFYDKDLEILTGPDLLLEGPVHSNADLYVGSSNTLDIGGQVTVIGDFYRGRKDSDTCLSGPVRVLDPDDYTEVPTCSGGRRLIQESDVTGWNGMIRTELTPLTEPGSAILDPIAGRPYWDAAEIRIVLDLNGGTPEVQVRDTAGANISGDTTVLGACGVTGHSTTLYDNREATSIEMLDVDVGGLLNCVHSSGLMGVGLDDTTDGGLVWYFSVDGPDSATVNNYGIRFANATELVSTLGGAPVPLGLTIASDQAVYIQGNFNAVNKIPAAFLADSINVLSNGWSDANSSSSLSSRVATATAIHAALFAGTDTTGNAEGAAGQDAGSYNGGLANFIRLHEDWTGVELYYRGSFVSLDAPSKVDGAFTTGDPYFLPPTRNWGYDTDFEDAVMLPPLSPEFVYLKQELFVRNFEL